MKTQDSNNSEWIWFFFLLSYSFFIFNNRYIYLKFNRLKTIVFVTVIIDDVLVIGAYIIYIYVCIYTYQEYCTHNPPVRYTTRTIRVTAQESHYTGVGGNLKKKLIECMEYISHKYSRTRLGRSSRDQTKNMVLSGKSYYVEKQITLVNN